MSTQPQADERVAFSLPQTMNEASLHFCPGCHHGIIHRLMGECLEKNQVGESTICVSAVGCSVFIYNYIDVDAVEAPHGRAPAVATGVKRARPDCFVFGYQGDGDLAAIGFSEIMHCANRGENVTIIFVNNTVFGMTGGQMAPTTLVGQTTTTSPGGRSMNTDGAPLNMSELIASLEGTVYSARVAVNTVKNIKQGKKALQKAYEAQSRQQGFSFIEFLSACPTNWKMNPLQANE
ncbi:MAG: thiamine pyrophosphate-dependent enzyme, partial [Desulfohalobiaceae bacterium]